MWSKTWTWIFFAKLKNGLSKTRANFTERMEDLVGASVDLDEDFMDEMEMILVAGDVGVKTTEKNYGGPSQGCLHEGN